MIGFLGSPYSTNESAGVLTVQVGVISGSLQTDVILNLSTIDVTAVGELLNRMYGYSNVNSIIAISCSYNNYSNNICTPHSLMSDGSDYEALVSVPLTFSPSSTLVEVKVTIIEDNVLESDESFNLILSHSLAVTRGVQINPASAEASIIDNDSKS